MALIIGLGDVATRIVRALTVRGRVPTQLDEIIVPTAQVVDLTDPIYAQNPTVWASSALIVGSVGNSAVGIVMNQTPGMVVAIDRVILDSLEAAADIYDFSIVRNAAAAGVRASVIFNTPSPTPQAAMVTQLSTSGAAAGTIFWQLPIAANGHIDTGQLGVILYPGDRLQITSVTQGAAVQAWMNVIGREFRP
jgi:hypothetical protein